MNGFGDVSSLSLSFPVTRVGFAFMMHHNSGDLLSTRVCVTQLSSQTRCRCHQLWSISQSCHSISGHRQNEISKSKRHHTPCSLQHQSHLKIWNLPRCPLADEYVKMMGYIKQP
jgi:hypothetical protein